MSELPWKAEDVMAAEFMVSKDYRPVKIAVGRELAAEITRAYNAYPLLVEALKASPPRGRERHGDRADNARRAVLVLGADCFQHTVRRVPVFVASVVVFGMQQNDYVGILL